MNEYELQHFGILGMKWGRRKAGGTSAETANRFNDLHNKVTKGNGSKADLDEYKKLGNEIEANEVKNGPLAKVKTRKMNSLSEKERSRNALMYGTVIAGAIGMKMLMNYAINKAATKHYMDMLAKRGLTI